MQYCCHVILKVVLQAAHWQVVSESFTLKFVLGGFLHFYLVWMIAFNFKEHARHTTMALPSNNLDNTYRGESYAIVDFNKIIIQMR